jgi:cytidylate kinase
MPHPLTEKLIQRQINHWNNLRQYLNDPPDVSPPVPRPVITISRQAGAGGRKLAEALAERLALDLHDRNIVEKIARDSRLSREMIEELDETEMNQARLWVQGVLNQRIFMRDQYHLAVVKVVTALASRGGAVFLGRGAHLILGEAATLRLRLVASHRTRLQNILERTNLSRAEARALMDETDRRRAKHTRKVFRMEPGKAEHFDLVINTERLNLEDQIDLVLQALLARQKHRQHGPLAEKAVQG